MAGAFHKGPSLLIMTNGRGDVEGGLRAAEGWAKSKGRGTRPGGGPVAREQSASARVGRRHRRKCRPGGVHNALGPAERGTGNNRRGNRSIAAQEWFPPAIARHFQKP